MIDYKIHNILLEKLFEQTDQAMKRASKDNADDGNMGTIVHTTLKDIFGKRARLQFLIQLIAKSVEMKKYSITYEVVKRFMSDLLKARYLPIFDQLF